MKCALVLTGGRRMGFQNSELGRHTGLAIEHPGGEMVSSGDITRSHQPSDMRMKQVAASERKGIKVAPRSSGMPRSDSLSDCVPRRHVTRQATWAVLESQRDTILGPGLPDWFNLEAHRGARKVKSGYRRCVWRVTTHNGTFFCKVFERDLGQSRLARALIPHPAIREWHRSLAARVRGVPVVEAIALGIGRSSWRSRRHHRGTSGRVVLITRAFEPSVPLSAPRRDRATHHAIIKAVAALYAMAHRRGFVHRDGHPGNVLVREQHGRYEARFLDVHSARFYSDSVPNRAAIRALGQLDHYFEVSAMANRSENLHGFQDSAYATQHKADRPIDSNADRIRFLKEYLSHRLVSEDHAPNPLRLIRKQWARAIRHQARRQAIRLARQRDRRLRRNGRYFARVDLGGGWRGTVLLALGRRHVFPESDIPDFEMDQWQDALTAGLSTISKAARLSEAQISRNGGFSRVSPCQVGNTRTLLFVQDRVKHSLRATLTGSDARRIFEHAHRLRHRDIAAPLVLGYLEHWSLGMINSCALIFPDQSSC